MKCQRCEKEFTPVKANHRKYCSRDCSEQRSIAICYCKTCGGRFESRHIKKYCSDKCNPHLQTCTVEPRKCAYEPCSKLFTPKNNKGKYCSNTCRTHQSHGKKHSLTGLPRGQGYILRYPPHSKIYLITCPITGILFTSRKVVEYHPTVTPSQIYRHKHPFKQKKHFNCNECGAAYKAHRTNGKCKECNQRTSKRIAKSKRRAKERSLLADQVDPYTVFRKHKWHCACCGKYTPISARGKQLHNSPELDHIIPLSKGGQHTYANTQLLCRQCNLNKSDSLFYKPLRSEVIQLDIYSQYGRVG